MSANQTKYPQLRFKGFTDPWEKRTLGQTTTKAKSYSLSRDVERDHETGYRYIHYGDIHTGVADIVTEHTKLPNIEPANYDELRVNDLVVADASEDYQGIAEPAVVVGLPTHLVAGLHTITLRPSSASSLYLYYLLHTDSFKHFGYQMGTGLKVFGISWSNLSKFTFMIPSRPEQEMIVKLIESVDNLIAVNQRKLAKLKELKQGYLQKMFPKNGSKFPQLRFAGFADDWEERKLGDVVGEIQSGNRLPKDSLTNGDVPYVVAQTKNDGVFTKIARGTLDYNGKPMKLFPGNSISFSIDNPEAMFYRNAEFYTSNIMRVIHEDHLTHEQYVFILENMKRFIRGYDWSRKFSGPVVSNLEYLQPSEEEQQKIGSFFKQLDDTIALHQRKLDLLKEQKKGFLQKMFV